MTAIATETATGPAAKPAADTNRERAAAPVVVVGAGWAGLSAAVHLVARGRAVTLIEAARQPGGRARTTMFDGDVFDNGQHIALGAYRSLQAVCGVIGLDEARGFARLPLSLSVMGEEATVELRARKLPAPLHLLAALARARGLSAADKLGTVLGWPRLLAATGTDMTVADLLRRSCQPARVCRALWRPLCIGALTTDPERASARLFQAVIRDAFTRRRADSDILLPRIDLGRVFPRPAVEWLSRRGARVVMGERVGKIQTAAGKVTGVATRGRVFRADTVILAADPYNAARLVRPISELKALLLRLARFEYEPITTVYLKYAKPVSLQPAMRGYADRTTQWIFDRRITGRADVIAAVISGAGAHIAMDKDELARRVARDIKDTTAIRREATGHMVIREKRAAFAATPAIDALRPPAETAIRGLILAGDYTQTGYPSTLEGATLSGRRAADFV